MVDVELIPDAWADIERLLINEWEGRRMSPSLMAAARRVVTEVQHYINHPAFLGQSVVGPQNIMLPGWRMNDGSVVPLVPTWDDVDEDRFVILLPQGHYEGRVHCTSWTPTQPKAAPTYVMAWLRYDELVRRPDEGSRATSARP